ncbi:hypothetical protein F5880DRAFT_1507588 [Lentinula raphanica]|nr:hypothetical protein F5880DRAFT_1507588 [Lentinula raphanica]
MYLFRSPLVLRGTKVFSRLLVLTGVILALSAFVNGMPVSSVNSTQMSLERRAGIDWEATANWKQLQNNFVHPNEDTKKEVRRMNSAIAKAVNEKARSDGDTVTLTEIADLTPPVFVSGKAHFRVNWEQRDGNKRRWTDGAVFFNEACPSTVTCGEDCEHERYAVNWVSDHEIIIKEDEPKSETTSKFENSPVMQRCTALRPLPSSTSPTRPSRARPIGSKLPRPVSPPRTQHTPSSPPTTQQQIRLHGVFANCTPREGQRWKRKEEGETGGTQRRGAEEENGGRHGEDEGEEEDTETACPFRFQKISERPRQGGGVHNAIYPEDINASECSRKLGCLSTTALTHESLKSLEAETTSSLSPFSYPGFPSFSTLQNATDSSTQHICLITHVFLSDSSDRGWVKEGIEDAGRRKVEVANLDAYRIRGGEMSGKRETG